MHAKFAMVAVVAALMLAMGAVSVLGESKPAKPPTSKDSSKSLIKDGKKGDVPAGSVIAFGPNGLLLMGSGRELFAVETGDSKPGKGDFKKVDDLKAGLAKVFGGAADKLRVTSTAVNPASGKLYLAVATTSGARLAVLERDGTLAEFKLKDMNHVRVKMPIPAEEETQFMTISWTDSRVICTTRAVTDWSSHVMFVPVPVVNGGESTIVDCNGYHTTHREWESRSPVTSATVYERDKKTYLVAGVSCTPVIQYPLDDVKPGTELKGTTPFDLHVQDVVDLFTYTKDKKNYLFLIYTRSGEDGFCLRVNDDFLTEKTEINDKAPAIITSVKGGLGVPEKLASRVKELADFDNVLRAMPYGDGKVLVIRRVKNVVSVEVLDLP